MKPYPLFDLYGIIGYPLSHSLSPVFHTQAFRARKIKAILLPWQTPTDKLPLFIEAMRLMKIKGCCVTLPHKEAVISMLDYITPQAKATGAVNCLYWQEHQLCGDNTDVIGFIDPLINNNMVSSFRQILLLGTGGAARAAIVGLKQLGYDDITVTGRQLNKCQQLAHEFNVKFIAWHLRGTTDSNFIINATPLGMSGKLQSETPYLAKWFKSHQGVAYDIVYTPKLTRFCQEARRANQHIITGLDMFLAQASKQFTRWTGHTLPTPLKNQLRTLINER